MRIPYGELKTINFIVNNENGHEHVLGRVHYAFVIPCRDCKHYDADDMECRENGIRPEPDGFCAWGEAREAL